MIKGIQNYPACKELRCPNNVIEVTSSEKSPLINDSIRPEQSS